MNNFIEVSRSRFYEIFRDSVYVSQAQITNPKERSSCPYYNVIDNRTNEIVGVYSDGSWENTFEVLIELASKEDIVAHSEVIIKRKEHDLESSRKAWKKLRDYKNLSPEQRAEIDKKEEEEREWRKTHPGLMSFMEDNNIIPYPNKEFSVDSIVEIIKEINSKT